MPMRKREAYLTLEKNYDVIDGRNVVIFIGGKQ